MKRIMILSKKNKLTLLATIFLTSAVCTLIYFLAINNKTEIPAKNIIVAAENSSTFIVKKPMANDTASTTPTKLEESLFGAWIQLEPSGVETDYEMNFDPTHEKNPGTNFYDYRDYLHQRPGVSGYWTTKDNTITIHWDGDGDVKTTYTNVKVVKNILMANDDDTIVKFKKFVAK